MELGRRLAEFASLFPEDRIPDAAYECAKTAIMDYISVLIAGIGEECAVSVRRIVETLGGEPQATVWGSARKTSVVNAALANAVAAHVLDFDDTSPVMFAHPSIQMLPGLFALGEYRHCSGKDFLTSYIVGFEIAAKIGRAINPGHIAMGWLPIGTLGPVMQSAACCRLLRMSPMKTQMALGLATNLASGIRCNNGTMAKPYLAGHSASSGVMAALLAEDGITSNPAAFEDRFGYFNIFSKSSIEERDHAIAQIGERFDIVESGIAFKSYPCCAGSHGAVDSALAIVRERPINPEEIEAIKVSIHAGVQVVLIHPRPETPAEARFSLEYCICRALLDRQFGPAQFSPAKVMEPSVRTLIGKVKKSFITEPVSKEDLSKNRFPVKLEVLLKNGTALTASTEFAKGTASNPLSPDELRDKFRQCCACKMKSSRISDLLALMDNFETLENIQIISQIIENI